MAKRQLAVIGLGQFGRGVTDTLIKQGHDVLVIDKKERLVSDYQAIATHAVVADTTEENRLKSLGLTNFDYVIVAIGEDIQASILTTLILKDMGVKNVWVKAINKNHSKILSRIGADYIIQPEKDIAKRLVNQLLHNHIMDFIELSDDHSIVEVKVSDRLVNRSIEAIDLRGLYGLSLIGIRHNGKVDINPSPYYLMQPKDVLIILGRNRSIQKFKKVEVYDEFTLKAKR
ncbi:ktr system potassium uptake protein C [Halolactibacillus miurensis]|uniref:Ktr system potassium uptake protein C n=1 Tax=Halolactibacillus miurensis TaxID=306541 RepID=A0A1I6R299_9BACI|nr:MULTISPECIES: TrkA family potassium uptake protein [Halolactibacillus]GEM03639.1 ktr system potassium uptake protein C [Halolactibacillus miurensis]SFS58841.1 trk system potassium uptake protein TrkA [Halolactibacillus miurensis]